MPSYEYLSLPYVDLLGSSRFLLSQQLLRRRLCMKKVLGQRMREKKGRRRKKVLLLFCNFLPSITQSKQVIWSISVSPTTTVCYYYLLPCFCACSSVATGSHNHENVVPHIPYTVSYSSSAVDQTEQYKCMYSVLGKQLCTRNCQWLGKINNWW